MTEQFVIFLLLLGIASNLCVWQLQRQPMISQLALFVAGMLTGILMKLI
jgi:hypothetical protein